MKVSDVSFSLEGIGRILKNTKERHTWAFKLGPASHRVCFTVSKWSGKLQLEVDGRLAFEGKAPGAGKFQHEFKVGGERAFLKASKKDYNKIDLFIGNEARAEPVVAQLRSNSSKSTLSSFKSSSGCRSVSQMLEKDYSTKQSEIESELYPKTPSSVFGAGPADFELKPTQLAAFFNEQAPLKTVFEKKPSSQMAEKEGNEDSSSMTMVQAVQVDSEIGSAKKSPIPNSYVQKYPQQMIVSSYKESLFDQWSDENIWSGQCGRNFPHRVEPNPKGALEPANTTFEMKQDILEIDSSFVGSKVVLETHKNL